MNALSESSEVAYALKLIVGKLDLEMLLLPGGRERTEEEYRSLLANAGFKLNRVVPTKSPVCVIEAEREN